MTYKTFYNELAAELKASGKLPEELVFTAHKKFNGVISHTLTIKSADMNIAPCIHLDYFYNEYLAGRDIKDIADSVIRIYCSNPGYNMDDISMDWDTVKDHVSYFLINHDANSELLEGMPHLDILNLSLAFRIDTAFLGISGYITIKNELFESFNITFSELARAAKENSPRLEPLKIIHFSDIISSEIMPEIDSGIDDDMLIITNKDKNKGAAVIFYPEVADVLASEGCSTHCIVIPSSIHELILVKKESGNIEYLNDTVNYVNRSSAISRDEYLSDNVYVFSELTEAFKNAFESLA